MHFYILGIHYTKVVKCPFCKLEKGSMFLSPFAIINSHEFIFTYSQANGTFLSTKW